MIEIFNIEYHQNILYLILFKKYSLNLIKIIDELYWKWFIYNRIEIIDEKLNLKNKYRIRLKYLKWNWIEIFDVELNWKTLYWISFKLIFNDITIFN